MAYGVAIPHLYTVRGPERFGGRWTKAERWYMRQRHAALKLRAALLAQAGEKGLGYFAIIESATTLSSVTTKSRVLPPMVPSAKML